MARIDKDEAKCRKNESESSKKIIELENKFYKILINIKDGV